MKSVSKNKLIRELSFCGQIAEHKSEKMQEHNMDENMLLKGLSIEEQDMLLQLLQKLKTYWIEEHKRQHSK